MLLFIGCTLIVLSVVILVFTTAMLIFGGLDDMGEENEL